VSTFPPVAAAPETRGGRVSRREVIERALRWVENRVPYSQTGAAPEFVTSGEQYRTDCSGFVSMAWRLRTSLTTATLEASAPCARIEKSALLSGDILLYPGHHTVVFYSWANAEHTLYYALEAKGRRWGTIASVRSVNAEGYFACRFNNIFDEPLTEAHHALVQQQLSGADENLENDDDNRPEN
jgi:hypothetical protein